MCHEHIGLAQLLLHSIPSFGAVYVFSVCDEDVLYYITSAEITRNAKETVL